LADNGPVQLVAIGFGPDAKFEGRIMEELGKLEQHGTVRILDLLFVRREPDSDDVVVLDLQGDELGGIVGALLGFEFEGADADAAPPADWAPETMPSA
jgi:hypothetical protein